MRLRHTWQTASDRAALAVCAEALAAHGIEFVDAPDEAAADAVKWHGHEMVDARRSGTALLDLSDLAREEGWDERWPEFVQRFSHDAQRRHGIAMGVHRGNVAWFNADTLRSLGGTPPATWPQWLAWLAAARASIAAPLAVGSAPEQIGLLFENAVLAIAGEAVFRRAFGALDPQALGSPAMVESLEELARLREFVADDLLALASPQHTERVRRGEAAVQVTADWLRPSAGPALRCAPVPGTAGQCITIVDFFVPLAGEGRDPETLRRAAAILGRADVQRRFAALKGCTPPDAAAFDGVGVVPSLAFDQACAVAMKDALLDVVARAFVERADPRGTAATLADVVT